MSDESAVASHPIFHKTKMCKFHLMGKCARSAGCLFAHGDEELQPMPNFHRTRMCPDLCETGRCDKGFACTYAHSTKELRTRTGKKASKACGERPRAAPVTAGRAAPAVPADVPPPPLASSAALAEARVLAVQAAPVVVLTQAFAVQAQPVQAVVLPCTQLPTRQPGQGSGCAVRSVKVPPGVQQLGMQPGQSTGAVASAAEPPRRAPPSARLPGVQPRQVYGSCSRSATALGGAQVRADPEIPPPPDHPPKLSLPVDSWSRQSTAEDAEGPALVLEFSRQSTPEEWVAVDMELDAQRAVPALEMSDSSGTTSQTSKAMTDDVHVGGVCEAPLPVAERVGHVAVGFGLVWAVKNTFLEFYQHQAAASSSLSRTRSTGDCLALYV
mmetsp:Transcript_81612/g.257386  ORF Transcript_81612/g.257386 Transcript_81612/m.257386 type:complete len:384 (-) Transcript_81612:205-1356(-)